MTISEMAVYMQKAVSDAEHAIDQASAVGSSLLNPFAPDLSSNISKLNGQLATLKSRMPRVLAGEQSYDGWMGFAKAIISEAYYLAGVKEEWSIPNTTSQLASGMAQTAKEYLDKGQNALENITDYSKWLIVGIVAIALIYVVFSVRSVAA